MQPDDLTVRVLMEIRDETRATRETLGAELAELRAELRATNQRIDALASSMAEGDLRVASELVAVHGAIQDVVGLMKDRRDLRKRVARCEREIGELKRKVG